MEYETLGLMEHFVLLSRKLATLALAASIVVLCTAPGLAAPFCIEAQGVPRQCLYYDITQCRDQAARISGICSSNPADEKSALGSAAYCIVDSSQIRYCMYPDPASCNAEAIRSRSVCMPNLAQTTTSDPFKIDYARIEQ